VNLIIRRRNRAGALAAAVAAMALVALSAAAPAHAAPAGLSGADWTQATLPSGNYVGDGQNGNPIAPVSCVAGTQFCLAVVSNPSVTGPNGVIGQSTVVSTDGGQTWNAYTGVPSASIWVTSASCVTVSVCWLAGSGPQDQPEVAESTDGGQTFTLQTPADWADTTPGSWWPNAIDCVGPTTCWLAGETANSTQNPVVAETTDGTDWTTFTNLPTITPYDPNGTYLLNAISCVSALDCVAAGGLDEADGVAQVISTTDGGATWALSTDPTLSGVQDIFSLSCLPTASGLPTCTAAADALEAAGPVILQSSDGGATWSGMETYDDTGWMSSVSCPDASHCWAAGAGTSVALVGTADGGSSWATVDSDTTNEYGIVSCATIDLCVATTDNALWVTTDDGGLGASAKPEGAAADSTTSLLTSSSTHVSEKLPKVSGAAVSGRVSKNIEVVGQYRGSDPATTATVTIRQPSGRTAASTVSIGLNDYYSVELRRLARGTTTVHFAAGNGKARTIKVHGYTAAPPTIRSLSAHAAATGGGATLTAHGTNFRDVTAVDFGATAGRDVRVLSSTELTVRVPPAHAGAAYVTVRTRNGGPSSLTGRSVFSFLPRPAIKTLSPSSGRTAGGNTVTIHGLELAYVRSIYFGTHKAVHLTVLSASEVKVTAPPGKGKVRVTVVTAGGRSRPVPGDVYSY
jgi:IPT/TIG domain